MDKYPKVTIIIPMYGKEEYTRTCVKLVKDNYGTGFPIEILVVDDGSPEPFADHTINVLRLDENSGYSNATNQGILWAQHRNADYVHLLNNDTEPKPGFLKHLLDIMEADTSIGIAGSVRILGSEQGITELHGADLIRGYQKVVKDASGLPDVIRVHWVPLCSSLISMDCIRRIGILDSKMKVWSSDLEYCIRASFADFGVVVVPASKVIHHHEVTTRTVLDKYKIEDDQRVLLETLAGMKYAKLMTELPLDAEANTWGRLEFSVHKK